MRVYKARVEIPPELVHERAFWHAYEQAILDHTKSWTGEYSATIEDDRGIVRGASLDDALMKSETTLETFALLELTVQHLPMNDEPFLGEARSCMTYVRHSGPGDVTIAVTSIDGPSEVEVQGLAGVLRSVADRHLNRLQMEAQALEAADTDVPEPTGAAGVVQSPWWHNPWVVTILGGLLVALVWALIQSLG